MNIIYEDRTTFPILDVPNLNSRKYIHGTSLLKGLLELVGTARGKVTDFSLRLHKPLYKLPRIEVYPVAAGIEVPPKQHIVASGLFQVDFAPHQYFVTQSDIDCTKVLEIDEKALEERIETSEERYFINDLWPHDDPWVALSAIERTRNLRLFKELGVWAEGMQMWFTGINLKNLEFLNEPLSTVSSSIKYELLSPKCAKRTVYYNGAEIGTRVAVCA